MLLVWPDGWSLCCCDHHRSTAAPWATPNRLDNHWLSAGTWLLFTVFPATNGSFKSPQIQRTHTSCNISLDICFPAVLSVLFLPGRYGPDCCSFLICMISCSCGRAVTKVVFSARAAETQVGVRRKKGEVLSTEVHCSAGIVCDVA